MRNKLVQKQQYEDLYGRTVVRESTYGRMNIADTGRFGSCSDEGDYRSSAAVAAVATGYPSDVIDGLGSTGAVQQGEKEQGRPSDVCGGRGKQDEVTVFTTRLFTRLRT